MIETPRLAGPRLIFLTLAALLLISVGLVTVLTVGGGRSSPPIKIAQSEIKTPVLDELVATTKALEISQQQAVDQLQVLQDMFAAQQAETRKSSERVAALNEKIEALRQSFASTSTQTGEAADEPSSTELKASVARPRAKSFRRVAMHQPRPKKQRIASKRR